MRDFGFRMRWQVARLIIRAGWKLAGVHVSPGRIYHPKYGPIDL